MANPKAGIERRIILRTLAIMREAGFRPHAIVDEEGDTYRIDQPDDSKSLLKVLQDLELATVYFEGPRTITRTEVWIMLIPGNGHDVISDLGFPPAFDSLADKITSNIED